MKDSAGSKLMNTPNPPFLPRRKTARECIFIVHDVYRSEGQSTDRGEREKDPESYAPLRLVTITTSGVSIVCFRANVTYSRG